MTAPIYTVGHSTRPIEEFAAILHRNGIRLLVDVRTIPRSRHNPQFEAAALARNLKKARIGYLHLPELGGLRKPKKDSINGAWRNESFKGYADYMQTSDFREALKTLIDLASSRKVAIMCAEAVPWRCHRGLIADALVARGFEVEHIIGSQPPRAHRLTPWAEIRRGRITYPESKARKSVRQRSVMPKSFRVGDRVSWNSEAGRVRGRIVRKVTRETRFKGYTHHASSQDPQYMIESEKTGHIALHRGGVLRKLKQR